MKVVPPNFGYVEEKIFRCGAPEPCHYSFLSSLRLRTVILLTDDLDESFIRFLQEGGTRIVCPLLNEAVGPHDVASPTTTSIPLTVPASGGSTDRGADAWRRLATSSSAAAVVTESAAAYPVSSSGVNSSMTVIQLDSSAPQQPNTATGEGMAPLNAAVGSNSIPAGGGSHQGTSPLSSPPPYQAGQGGPASGGGSADNISTAAALGAPPTSLMATASVVGSATGPLYEPSVGGSGATQSTNVIHRSHPVGGRRNTRLQWGFESAPSMPYVQRPLAVTPSVAGSAYRGTMSLPEPVVVDILRVLLDPIHYPLLLTCSMGKYRTGVVCGCLRKIQRWNLVAILEEYRRFAGDQSRLDNEEFIELFDVDLVDIQCPDGRRPTIMY